MIRVSAGLVLSALALTGCTLTDSRPDYGRGGYDPGYAYGGPAAQPYPAPPAYGAPAYPPPYGGPGYAPPGYDRGYDRNRDRDYGRDRRDGRPPAGPQLAPGVNIEAVQAGDQLVGSIDRYLQANARNNQPVFNDMKRILIEMRAAAETWRNAARSGGHRQSLQAAANDLLNRFNAANQRYASIVASNPRYKSNEFAAVATATERVVYSVR